MHDVPATKFWGMDSMDAVNRRDRVMVQALAAQPRALGGPIRQVP
jgi:hypothetical protein